MKGAKMAGVVTCAMVLLAAVSAHAQQAGN